MIFFTYTVKESFIRGAGKGLFTETPLESGKVLVAPDRIEELCQVDEITTERQANASVRWFEQICSIAEHWPDECYINHSFSPNSLWHLGFVFALRPIQPGEEITMDYSHLLADGVVAFTDAETDRPVCGLPWNKALSQQLSLLQQALRLANDVKACVES